MKISSTWSVKNEEMSAINGCRVYLQVIFTSDITSYDGKIVLSGALKVVQFRRSTLKWPR